MVLYKAVAFNRGIFYVNREMGSEKLVIKRRECFSTGFAILYTFYKWDKNGMWGTVDDRNKSHSETS